MPNKLRKLVKDALAKAGGKGKHGQAADLSATGPSGHVTSLTNPVLAESTYETPAGGKEKGKHKDTEMEGDDGGEESNDEDDVERGIPPKAEVEQHLALPSTATTIADEEREAAKGADIITVSVPLTSTNKSGHADSSTSKVPVMAAISASTEEFGLFPFPPRQTADGTPASEPEPQASAKSSHQYADIIVVHGVGGHRTKTWQASDGAIWPRDRIPELFADTNICCRIRSFGYNSASFFTRGGIDIRDCAKDLIDRIRVLRRKDTDEFRPIIFVAHSLGGILVKEALNRAWTKQRLYEDVLGAVRGCIFLGVPHRGAAIASWAKHASQITKYLTLGFAGNTDFLGALEPDSKEWIRISDDFVDRGKDLAFYTFYETKKTGNLMVVDKSSAIMHLPNEECFAVQGSDHRTIARFTDDENQRFALVGDAVYTLVRSALKGKQQNASPQPFIFDLPPATSHFFGREMELDRLRDVLDPSKPAMKGIVLYGLAGSGKTQLALNFIENFKWKYSAILWINASSREAIVQSFQNIEAILTETWPSRDLPNPISRGATAEKVVLSRLRSTIYNQWLLVIDSADDVETTNFASFIPSRCRHGSVIVTSTRRSAVDQFESAGFCSQEVDSLDAQSAGHLLHFTASPKRDPDHLSSTESTEAIKIVKELHGIPLAVEQAGVLIRKNIVTFDNFIDKYSTHYKILMNKRPTPGVTFYEKEHSVVTIVSLLFSGIQAESPDSARLLRLLCVLGHQSIPLGLLRSLAYVHSGLGSTDSQGPLAKLVSDDTLLLICMSTLSDVCLVKFRDNQARTDKVISVHGLICRWVIDMVLADDAEDLLWIVEGVMNYIQPSIDSPIFPYRPDHEPFKRAYAFLLDRTIKVAQDILKVDLSLPSKDDQLARLQRKLAYVYLATGRLEEARSIIEGCIELERELQADSWPLTESNLELLVALAVCRQKSKDHQAAIDALQTSLRLAESLFDDFDDRTAEISGRLKSISERQETELQQHKAVVLASTGPRREKQSRHRSAHEMPFTGEVSLMSPEEWGSGHHESFWNTELYPCILSKSWDKFRILLRSTEPWFDINFRTKVAGKTLLMLVLSEESDTAAEILLDEKSSEMDLELRDYQNQNALFYASLENHTSMVRRLVNEFGIDPNLRDIYGKTALLQVVDQRVRATMGLGSELDIIEELVRCGANPDIPDHKGLTPFMVVAATDNLAATEDNLELLRLFYSTGKISINRQDCIGDNALHFIVRPKISNYHYPYIVPKEGFNHQSVAAVRQIIDWGIDVNLKNNRGRTPLHEFLSHTPFRYEGTALEVLAELILPQPDINCHDKDGTTVIHLASKVLVPPILPIILDFSGADLNARDNNGLTPLMFAARAGNHLAVAELTRHKDVDVNALTHKGKSALFYAMEDCYARREDRKTPLALEALLDVPGIKLGFHGHGVASELNSVLFAALCNGCALEIVVKRSLVETQAAVKVAEERRLSALSKLITSMGVKVHGKRAMKQAELPPYEI